MHLGRRLRLKITRFETKPSSEGGKHEAGWSNNGAGQRGRLEAAGLALGAGRESGGCGATSRFVATWSQPEVPRVTLLNPGLGAMH